MIEFLSTSHGVRTEYLWIGHGVYLFYILSQNVPLEPYTNIPASTDIRAYSLKYFTAQHKGPNDSRSHYTACFFFLSDIHLLL